MDLTFLILSTLVFAGGFAFSVISLRAGKYHPGYPNLIIIGLGFALQCGFLNLRGELHGRCPITDGSEILVFIAWSLAIMYFVLGQAFRLSLVGAFTAPILAILQILALILALMNPVVARPVETVMPWLEMHKSVSLLAYGAFAFAAIAGIMYMIQNRQLKKGNAGTLFYNLPPISYLSDALVRLLIIGLVLLTLGVITAFFMEIKADAFHLAISIGVWVIYAGVVAYHFLRRPPAKWLSIASMVAFIVALLTLSVI